MSYDVDKALVTKVLETRDVRTLTRYKVTDHWLSDPDARRVFDYIMGRWERHGKVPSLTLVQKHHPDFEPEETDDSLELILDNIQERRLYADLQLAVKQIAKETKIDPKEGLATLREIASKLGAANVEGTTTDLTTQGHAMKRDYQRFKKLKGLLGLPWPWEGLNTSTGGILRRDFHMIYGPEATMKTWLLMRIADHVHKKGIIPSMFVVEQDAEELRVRFASMRAKVNYEQVRHGKLSAKDEARYNRVCDKLDAEPPFLIDEIQAVGLPAVAEIFQKAEDSASRLILFDGWTFLAKDQEWTSFAEISLAVKKACKRTKIPFITTHHTNRGGHKTKRTRNDSDTEDMANDQSAARWASVLIRVSRTPQNKENEELLLTPRKVREGIPRPVMINAKPAYDFSQKFVMKSENGADDDGDEPTKGDNDEGGILD